MKIALATAMLALAAGASAQDRPDLRVTRTAQPPVIDGVLDDDAWRGPAMDLGAWVSYNPLRGDTMPGDFRTEVRITYDARNLYLAFHCFDNEADKIRTTITRRDSAFNDDWIAMSLDSAGTGQSAYHLFVNPSGSQMDALNTSASGEQFDADFIWYSVGKRTADGYIVEVSLPLQSLRFSSGNDVRMGILFFRKISRLGVSYSWPDMPSGQWVFDRNARLLFESLNQPRLVEALPSATYGVSQTRPSSGDWDPANDKADFGLSGKFGITSNITLDGTINPDFSQVESDAYQIEVNQRFPIFYSEKRPFFMEGMGLFNIAGTEGDSNMRTAVHTRRIVNPFWGSKVTGTAGKTTFGVLNASDERPEDIGNRGFDFTERDKLFTIARVTRAFTGSDYAGAILTDTRHAGRSNTVAGADVAVKFSPPQQFSATVLFSQTSADGIDTQGPAAQMSYSYQTRRFNWSNQIEHYDRAFQMDTAFYNRTGFTTAWSFGEVNFYPRSGTNFWLHRVHPFVYTKFGHDEVQDGDEAFVNTGIRLNFTRQGFFNLAYSRGREPWLGTRYTTGRDFNVFAEMQIVRWLEANGGVNRGPDIFYDPVAPFQGQSASWWFGLTFQPNQHFTQEADTTNVRFDNPSTGARVYDVNVLNLKTTYQFDKHFLVRFLTQYDSASERILTDLLGSYELVPGTVFHAGYGSLYEKSTVPGARPTDPSSDRGFTATTRGLFFKASYLHRF